MMMGPILIFRSEIVSAKAERTQQSVRDHDEAILILFHWLIFPLLFGGGWMTLGFYQTIDRRSI